MKWVPSRLWHSALLGILAFAAVAPSLVTTPARALERTPRVAIFADDGAQAAADLLMARLSKDKELILVERMEINKVLHELSLSASGNLEHDLSLASLLHADGIVILESRKVQDKPVLSARLVASSPGIVIGAGLFGGPTDALTDSVATRFRPLWSKLTVMRNRAIPVSLLNLRCALGGSEAIESQLTFLLSHQLIQQRELFVLERWRMDDLVLEKGLEHSTQGIFWNSSYVVDGRIESTPNGKLKVTVFLRPPGNSPAREIEAVGEKEDLAKIAGQLTALIVEKLSKQPAAAVWKGTDESSKYLNEAKWAFEARLFSVARSAAEASWALGNRDPDLFRLRIRIYSALAYPLGVQPSHGVGPSGQTPNPMCYNRDVIDVGKSDQHLRAAMQALDYYEEYAPLHFPDNRRPEDNNGIVGSTPVLAASRVLRNYYERGLLQSPDSGSLAELCRKIRKAATLLSAIDAHLDKPARYDSGGHPIYFTKYSSEIEAIYFPFWYKIPSQALEGYRAVLERPSREFWIRDRLLSRQRPSNFNEACNVPWLVGWNGESATELGEIWTKFVDSLEASSDLRESLDGALLQVSCANTKEDKDKAAALFYNRMWEKRDELFQKDLANTYFQCLNKVDGYGSYVPEGYRQRWLDYYLHNASTFDYNILNVIWQPRRIESLQVASETFNQWLSYKERLSAAGKLSVETRRGCAEFESRLFQKFPELCPVTTLPTVQVTRHWQPDRSLGNLGSIAIWQENQLWVTFTTPRDQPRGSMEKPTYGVDLCTVQLPSFAVTKAIETPKELAISDISYGPKFYLSATSLILRDKNQFHRYDRQQGTWTAFSLPERNYSCFLARGNELFAGFSANPNNESGILGWSAATKEIKVIASNRRRPGLHIFDDRPAYFVDGLFGGQNGELGVITGLTFYLHKPGTSEWEAQLAPGTLNGNAEFGDCTLLYSLKCGVAVIDNETGVMTELPGSHFGKNQTGHAPAQLPEAFHLFHQAGTFTRPIMTYADGRLWTLRMEDNEIGRSLILNRAERFDKAPDSSSDVHLVFKPADDQAKSQTGETARIAPIAIQHPSQIQMVATNEGLVFSVADTKGLWLMSFHDFDAAIALPAHAANSK